ncbi:MAG: hypothetical protein M1385_02725 [Candidatus Marsarchaeota archaeon]|nr:hypothetical protein [Candidatus Marsarchaeota archaeon]
MNNIIVAIPNDIELAQLIGKKGTENGIVFYNRKINNTNIVVLTPSDTNEKYYGFAQSIFLSDIVILSTRTIDALFGEAIIASDLLGKRVVLTDDNSVEHITKNLSIEIEVCNRENILQLIENIAINTKKENNSNPKVVIDKAFPVKGVGDIALGIVINGVINVHDNLTHTSGKVISIRHIQSHDVDIESADASTRVGIAIKGIDSKDIERGDILAKTQIKRAMNITLQISKSNLLNIDVSKERFDVSGVFSYSAAKMLSSDSNIIKISLAKALPLSINDKLLLVRTKQPRIFAIGTVKNLE